MGAASIAREEAPIRSETPSECLMPVDSRNFSSRCTSRTRSWMARVRARAKSRSLRIGSGGTILARSSPWVPNWASQAASESVFLPGMFLAAFAAACPDERGIYWWWNPRWRVRRNKSRHAVPGFGWRPLRHLWKYQCRSELMNPVYRTPPDNYLFPLGGAVWRTELNQDSHTRAVHPDIARPVLPPDALRQCPLLRFREVLPSTLRPDQERVRVELR